MLLLTDLPSVMLDKEHWEKAAACMRRWFRSGTYRMPDPVKRGATPMSALGSGELETNLITMDWALRTARMADAHGKLIKQVWRNPKGSELLAGRIGRFYSANASCQGVGKTWRFGDLAQPVKTVDETCQVNTLIVGDLLDPLDDVYGAIGTASMKVAASGMVTNGKNGLPETIAVDLLGVYIRDTYDFNGDQRLGLWSWNGINRNRAVEGIYLKTGLLHDDICIDAAEARNRVSAEVARQQSVPPIGYEGLAPIPPPTPQDTARTIADVEKAFNDPEKLFGVSNAVFERYRAKTGIGHDYVNVTDIKLTPVQPPVSFKLQQ